MSLRLKLLLALIGLVVVGLTVSGVLTYTTLRRSLTERVDQELLNARYAVGHVVKEQGGPFGQGPPGSLNLLPSGTYGELLDSSGHSIGQPVLISYTGDTASPPSLPSVLPRPGVPATHADLFNAPAEDDSLQYRVVVQQASTVDPDLGSGLLIVAVPLSEVTQTLRQLLVTETFVALGVALFLGLISGWLVRREMRPLERMGETAGAIAQGDLTQRVADQNPHTEVGRLGLALNAMLSQIEVAFAERHASEDRLRRFLADASHELRTPLTSIRGYAELFRRGAGDRREDLEKSMRRIEDESARMGVMVEDLLLLSRLDQGRPLERAPVDLVAVAADAVADARVADPARPIELDAPESMMVMADEARLRQVAANLLSNALTHTAPATPVTVRVALTDDHTILEVADRGSGLEPEQVAKVFEPFYRSDPSRDRATGGAGLGLAIVAAIADAHGGRVEAAETPGGGATFRVVLPLQPHAEDPSDAGAASVPSA